MDSANSDHPQSRYDILTAEPEVRITTRLSNTLVERLTHAHETSAQLYQPCYESADDPISIIETEFEDWKSRLAPQIASLETQNVAEILPGLYGYFGYDLGRRFEIIPETAERDIDIPDLACGFYSWIIIVDHHRKRSQIINISTAQDNKWLLDLLSKNPVKPSSFQLNQFHRITDWESNLPKKLYHEAFEKIKSYIEQGDCYQINLTHRLSSTFEGDPWLAYKQLRQTNPNPFSAYIDLGSHQIMSFSPEQFIRVADKMAQTRPIKGTLPRDDNPTTDTQLAEQLSRSEKNRAENLMIVDLLRNDFSKHCLPQSVRVPALFDLESFPTVHHLVSTVVGELAPSQSALQLLKSCFPGGSITGAPKIRAMEIIEEIEAHRRSIYCGSILYLDVAGRLDSNITIRTLLCHRGSIYCWAGGGIVTDSECDDEYQETFDKIKGLLNGLD